MISEIYFEFVDCLCHHILRQRWEIPIINTECIITLLWYEHPRNLYPNYVFDKKSSRYGVQIYECRHPQVKEYIEHVIHNAIKVILLNTIIIQIKNCGYRFMRREY